MLLVCLAGSSLGFLTAEKYSSPQPSVQPFVQAEAAEVFLQTDTACPKNEITEAAGKYGFAVINESNWDSFTEAVKTGYLEEFERKMGVNYFQILSMTGDITNAKTYLRRTRADINKKDITGMTPVGYAAKFHDLETIRLLYENGADIFSAVTYEPKARYEILRQINPPRRLDPLNLAILQNNPENTPQIVRWLLDNGMNFADGNSYVFDSLRTGGMMDEFLPSILKNTDLASGIIPSAPDKDKTNAVSRIFQHDQTGRATEWLLANGLSGSNDDPDFPVLNAAVMNNNIPADTVRRLISVGFSVNNASVGNSSLTPLAYAVSSGRYDVAEILLENGAEDNQEVQKRLSRLPEAEQAKFRNILKKYGDSK